MWPIWQDQVIALGAGVFIIALIPAIISTNKPPASTSLITAIVLTTYVCCFLTLGLIVSAIFSGGTAICWWILFFQKRG